MTVTHAMSFPNDPMEGEKFLILRRPCSCTCACIGRPNLEVFLTEGDGKEHLLGYILHPFSLCAQELEVQDKHKNAIFRIEASCMQLGLCCSFMPCEACQFIHFDVKSPDGEKNLANLDRVEPNPHFLIIVLESSWLLQKPSFRRRQLLCRISATVRERAQSSLDGFSHFL